MKEGGYTKKKEKYEAGCQQSSRCSSVEKALAIDTVTMMMKIEKFAFFSITTNHDDVVCVKRKLDPRPPPARAFYEARNHV